ncbi:uncharacterized protein LOC129963937 isoform X2 [Argiope bruennichi]|uniref:uncharacterized protein LOC129963937 isoform X2 n=2 Tax=Argiope bruennichi TaxID=94029 RepID=UPI00249562E8|nr:uncharacterized protein LOC129963937 isoform X2 [Argiope bruennichi]
MEFSLFPKEKVNRCRKKVIPWHVQQRYMESFSQLSLNQTIATAFYKKKIKSLQRNNKHLALALQRSRYLATDKENLLIENGKVLDIINFSRLKLTDMAISMKQATECLDETLLLLNSSIADNLSKHPPNNLNYRNDFKSKLQELSQNSPIEEMSEYSDSSSSDVKTCGQKGKISRVDACSSSPNKRCKLSRKARNVKRNSRDVPKFSKESSSAVPYIDSKDSDLKNSKKRSSALNIKPSNQKKSLPKSSNSETPSSSKVPTVNSDLFSQYKNKQESLDQKRKVVKVILADIAEAFINRETENYRSPETNELASSETSTDFKHFPQNSPVDNILIEKCFSTEINSKQKSLNVCSPQLGNNAEVTNHSQKASNSSDFSNKNLSSPSDISENNVNHPAPSSERNEDFVCGRTGAIVKMQPVEKSGNGRCIKSIYSQKGKKSYKPQNTKAINKVQFYFDEDAIEKVDGRKVASKDRIRKSINKSKVRKTVSNAKKNIASKSIPLNSSLILPDNISKLGKNSFLVTAEVHSPPKNIHAKEIKSKVRAAKKMDPCVILTDIFKSNQGLLSEMVADGLHENGCFQMTIKNSAEAPLGNLSTNDLNTTYMDFENRAENRCLPEDKEIIEKREQRRRSKIVSYKEPSLHVKLRRI